MGRRPSVSPYLPAHSHRGFATRARRRRRPSSSWPTASRAKLPCPSALPRPRTLPPKESVQGALNRRPHRHLLSVLCLRVFSSSTSSGSPSSSTSSGSPSSSTSSGSPCRLPRWVRVGILQALASSVLPNHRAELQRSPPLAMRAANARAPRAPLQLPLAPPAPQPCPKASASSPASSFFAAMPLTVHTSCSMKYVVVVINENL